MLIKKVGTDGLVADSHSTRTEYRYTGANPNNYISFNNELWRIIGVFDVDDGTRKLEKRIKIIRDSIGTIGWNSNQRNNWTTATGMKLLNEGDYWNRTGSYASNGLTPEAKSQIADAKWYLGGTAYYDSASNGLASHFYGSERGRYVVFDSYPTDWTGKVALMYPSDYGYATSGGTTKNREACLAKELHNWNNSSFSDCVNNNWLLDSSKAQWTLTPYIDNSWSAFYVESNGSLQYWDVNHYYKLRPSIYLKSDIQLQGEGTSSSPYEIIG